MDLQQSLNKKITWLHRRLFNFLRWLRLFSLFGGYSWRNLLSAVGVCLLAALGLSLWQGLVLIVAQYCLTRRLAAQARSHGGLSGLAWNTRIFSSRWFNRKS